MNKFIKRCEKEGNALNKEKMEHKVPAVTFMGHKITEKGLEVDPEKVIAIEKFPAPTKGESASRVFRFNQFHS